MMPGDMPQVCNGYQVHAFYMMAENSDVAEVSWRQQRWKIKHNEVYFATSFHIKL